MTAKIFPQSRGNAALACVLALVVAFGLAGSALAQQGSFQPPTKMPQNSGQGGSTLELPTGPGHQGGNTDSIPRFQPQPGQELTVPSRQLRAQLGYEQVAVTVINQQGRYITDLQKGDFNLYIDGQQRPIEFFRQDLNTPVSLGIVVDTSGSMEPKLPQAKAAIVEMINDLNAKDDVVLFAFNNGTYLLQPFTMNHQLVIARLDLLHAFGQTALYDGVIDGLQMLRHGRWDKKALLIITDGMDNVSSFTLNDVIAEARRRGVLIYTIGIGESSSSPVSVSIGPFALLGGQGDEVDARTLKTLSNETGAKTFLFREMGDGIAMRNACETISRELREQYTIGFVAPDASRGGYRDLRVDVPSHPDDSVRVRKGVTVGTRESESASSGFSGGASPDP